MPTADQLPSSLRKVPILVAQALQKYHFERQPLDEDKAREWIKAYMEALDYNHLIFLASDYNEFLAEYPPKLPQMTMQRGDISPAFEIFKRFRDRLQARIEWVKANLAKPITFTDNDFFERDRTKAAWPATMEEADNLWHLRIKADLLEKKLAEKKPDPNSKTPDKKPEDYVKAVLQRYDRFYRAALDYDAEDILQLYLSSLAGLYDPHSMYMSPSTLEDFAISMKLSLVGIGAVLSSEDGYCVIKDIVPGGPAQLCEKIHINDKIIAVAQGSGPWIDIIDMKLRNAVQLIRGQKDTVVRLRVVPADATDPSTHFDIALKREVIALAAQQASAQIVERSLADGKTQKIGVIDLPSFYGDIDPSDKPSGGATPRSTTEDVKALVSKLKAEGVDGIILDLRRNGGGLLDEAVNLTGLFIGNGPVVQVKDQNGIINVRDATTPTGKPFYTGPLIVLTSRLSASASEIFAGALQNYNRAIIVGDKSTHGKGTVQAVVELGKYLAEIGGESQKAGALKITIQKFYLPNGHSTQNRGILPDISIPSANDFLKIGEADEPHALQWDEISPSKFTLFHYAPLDIISKLRAASQARLASDKLFAMVREDIERLRVRMDTGRISLNEKTRLAEQQSDEQRKKEFDKLQKQVIQNDHSKVRRFILKDDSSPLTVEELSKDAKMPKDPAALQDDDDSGTSTGDTHTNNVDLYLRETLNIMSDYLNLLKKPPVETLTATTAPAPTGTH